MLGFIPKIYPDEILYSFIARYHIYSLSMNPNTTANDLFKEKRKIATPDLPINLLNLQENIKGFWNVDIEELLYQHTFFNFYTNFILVTKKKSFVKNSIGHW